MNRIIIGIFIILHGLVHFLYIAVTQGWLKESGMAWNEKSLLLSKLIDETGSNKVALVTYSISIVLFVASGIVYMTEAVWWQKLIIISVIFSSITIVLFWDGIFKNMAEKGFIGVIINMAILTLSLIYNNK